MGFWRLKWLHLTGWFRTGRSAHDAQKILFLNKTKQQVSIITLQGRIVVPYDGYNKHLDLIANGASIGAAKIVYQRSSKTYYLMVSVEVETPELDPLKITRVTGVSIDMLTSCTNA